MKKNKKVTVSLLLAIFALVSPLSVKAATTHYPDIKGYESPLVLVKMSFDEKSEGDLVLLYGGNFNVSDFLRSDDYKNEMDPLWTFYWAQVKTGQIKVQ